MARPVEALDATIRALLDCACVALADAGRPACGCGMTVGAPIAAFCCECDSGEAEGGEGNLHAHLERMFDADPETLQQVNRITCRRSTLAAEVTLLLTRCYPTIDEDGQPPGLEETTEAANGLHADASVLWQALTCCGPRLYMRDVLVSSDPEGGCSLLAARVTVEIPARLPQLSGQQSKG